MTRLAPLPTPRYWIKRRARRALEPYVTPDVIHIATPDGRPGCQEARALLAAPWWDATSLTRRDVEDVVAALPDLALHRRCWAPDTEGDDYMTTDLARRDDLAGMNLQQQMQYAETLANAGLLPEAYRRQPANVLLAMQYGSALQIPTMSAIIGVHIIEGRQVPSAHLVGGLVRRAGHILRVTASGSGKTARAVATINRRDDPSFTFRAEWDYQRAEDAGLTEPTRNGKPSNWVKHPVAMAKRRAIYEVTQDACPEVLLGIDLSDMGEALDDLPVEEEQDASPHAADESDVVDAEIVEPHTKPVNLDAHVAGLDFDGLRRQLNIERERLGLAWSDVEADYAETYENRALRDAPVEELRAFVAVLMGRVRS